MTHSVVTMPPTSFDVPASRIAAAKVPYRVPESADLPERLHLVTALHACDTATDDALLLAIRRNADHVAVVPCCQAEVARQLASAKDVAPAVDRGSSVRGVLRDAGVNPAARTSATKFLVS